MKSQQDFYHTLLMMLLGAVIYLVVQCAFLQKAFKQFQEECTKRHEDHVTNLQAKPPSAALSTLGL